MSVGSWEPSWSLTCSDPRPTRPQSICRDQAPLQQLRGRKGAPLQPAATLSFAQRPRPGSQLTAQLSTSPGPPGPLLAPHHLTVTGFPRRLGGESGSGTSHMEKPETLLALERAEITAKHKCGPVGATAAGTVMFQAGIPAKAEKAEPRWVSSPGGAGMAWVAVTASGTRWPRQDPSQVRAAPTRAGGSRAVLLGRRAGEVSCPSFGHTSGLCGFQGQAGAPVEPGEDADRSLYKVADRLRFLP
nr:uncharacterized protein LOC115849534 [Globicephala melas]XP_030706745.1 uncharacterized protein LOC115849534 [Globicephala melas]